MILFYNKKSWDAFLLIYCNREYTMEASLVVGACARTVLGPYEVPILTSLH